MNDVDLLLRLLEVRASHLSGCSFMYAQVWNGDDNTDTPSAPAREDLYDAQAAALRDFAAEIRAGLLVDAKSINEPAELKKDNRYLFIQEMAGAMTATVHNTWQEIEERESRYDAEHKAYFEGNGNGVRHRDIAVITPRKEALGKGAAASSVLDVRWVMITDVDREFCAAIYDTEEELQRASDEFELEYAESIKSRDAVWTWHELLIPPRSEADGPDR